MRLRYLFIFALGLGPHFLMANHRGRVLLPRCDKVLNALGDDQGYFLEDNQKIILTGEVWQGLGNGLLYGIRRENSDLSWAADHQEHPEAAQGDVRWVQRVFGLAVAEFLGFREFENNLRSIPNADHTNAAIEAINVELISMGKAPIAARFYSTPLDRVLTDEYLRRFADEGALPISEAKPSMVHDAAFHVGSIIFPDELWDHARLITAYVVKYRRETGLRGYTGVWSTRLSEIDAGSANLFTSVVGEAKAEQFDSSVDWLVGQGLSPRKYLGRRLREYTESSLGSIGVAWLRFEDEHSLEAEFNRDLAPETIAEFCRNYAQNVRNIRQAVSRITKRNLLKGTPKIIVPIPASDTND